MQPPLPRPGLALIVMAALCAACGSAPQDASAGPIAVAASVPPQAELVARIGGERIEVQVLAPPGSDPHSLQLSDSDVARLMRSRAYFRTGVPFERGNWLKALRQTGRSRVVDLRGAGVHEDHDHAQHDQKHHHHHEHGEDPHIWLEPGDLLRQAELIRDSLVALDPAGAEGYRSRHAALAAELGALQQELAERLAPYRGRAFAVYHPAWAIFAEAYGLRQLAVEVDGQEPTDAELTSLQQQLREAGVSTLFVQPQFQGRSAQRVAEALDLRVLTLDPLARDPIANLRAVTDALVASWESPKPAE